MGQTDIYVLDLLLAHCTYSYDYRYKSDLIAITKGRRSMLTQIKRFWFPGALVIMCAVIVLIIWQPSLGSDSKLRDFGAAPEFELVDTEGNIVSLNNTKGKVRLAYFFFSNCPDVCPPTTAMLSKLQTELKTRDIFAEETAIFSITFDPNRDTTDKL